MPNYPPCPAAAEEMWTELGGSCSSSGGSLAYEPWPQADESLLVQSTYNLPVQVGVGREGCPVPRGCLRAWVAAQSRLPPLQHSALKPGPLLTF